MNEETIPPWYKQFWPWFLFGLPGSVVVAGLITVWIAIDGSDDMVNDDYYKEGLAINQQLEKQQLARDLGLRAELNLDGEQLSLTLRGNTAMPSTIELFLSHPASDTLDIKLTMVQAQAGYYLARATIPPQRYYLSIEGLHYDQRWRLKQEVHFGNTDRVDVLASDMPS